MAEHHTAPTLASILAALLALALPGRAPAQEAREHEHHACRDGGSPARADELPPPPWLDGIGQGSMAITTGSPLAQRSFDQGLALLHCFWDFEALRAFKAAVRHDPDAAMAHWGVWRSLQYNRRELDAERAAALARAVELAPRASDREQRYIRAAQQLAALPPAEGRQAYIRELEALIDRYPDDLQAKLFLADFLRQGYEPDGRPREGQLYSQAILRGLLATHPQSAAVHHYWIHAVENSSRPEEGLASAAALPALAPGCGHIAHMPGHIYFRLGEHGKAREAFLESMRIDRAYMEAQRIAPVDTWNYVHNLDYLVGNCAEDGRYREGLRWAEELAAIPADPGRPKSLGLGFILYGGHTARARLQMRYGFWDEAVGSLEAALARPTAAALADSLADDYHGGVLDYARGMAAVERGDAVAAGRSAESLAARLERLAKESPKLGSDWYFGSAAKILEVNLLELRGAAGGLAGRYEEAIALLEEAARKEKELGYWEPPHYTRPVVETLAGVAMRAGRWQQALDAWQASLALRPKNGHALLGIARVRAAAGQRAEAAAAYQAFLASWRGADRDLPQVEAATRWLAEHGAAGDRQAAP